MTASHEDDKAMPETTLCSRPHLGHVDSAQSSVTHVYHETPYEQQTSPDGHGECAIPVDKKEKAIEDDWDADPINPRNWNNTKKWVMVIIVGCSLIWSATRLADVHIGLLLHADTAARELHDGAWSPANR